MKDERIEQAKNKIRSEMAVIIFIGSLVSFLIKTWVFDMDMQAYITEYVIMIFFPLYQFIRMNMMKISIYSERGNKQSFRNLVITIALLAAASAVPIFNSVTKSEVNLWQNPAVRMVTFLVLFTALVLIANKYNQHRAHKYEKELDDDK